MTQTEKSTIKGLLQSSEWRVIEKALNELCDRISSESCIKDTEWETLTAVLMNEGKVYGLRQFLNELYKESL